MDSIEKVALLSKYRQIFHSDRPIPFFIQVNTSGEDSKHGVCPEDLLSLVRNIFKTRPLAVQFSGLMTIGSKAASLTGINNTANADFDLLARCRKDLIEEMLLPGDSIALSMGMSADYQQAVWIAHRVNDHLILPNFLTS